MKERKIEREKIKLNWEIMIKEWREIEVCMKIGVSNINFRKLKVNQIGLPYKKPLALV